MKLLKNISGVAVVTLLSRMLGAVRDILLAYFLGGGKLMTAWVLAFTTPNLFRRFFGEGAVGSAVVPIIAYSLEQDERRLTRRKLAAMIALLGIVLAVICLMVAAGSMLLAPFLDLARFKWTLRLIPVLIPYALFICLTAVMAAALHSLGRFFLPACSALLLNICLILCLLWIVPRITAALPVLYSLAGAVLLAGVLQLALMLFLLGQAGLLPEFQLRQLFRHPAITELWRLALPGILGASVLQLSLLVDKWLACWLSDTAVPALYYSDRIIYLPIGVFAVSMGTVILPQLSRHAVRKDQAEFKQTLIFGLRQISFICVPLAAFILYFRKPLLVILFMRGEFGPRELDEAAWALQFYAFGIPAFAAVKVLVAGFHARKEMTVPVRISICCIVINIILNLVLMWPLRQGGIALATVIAALLNCILLIIFLRRRVGKLGLREFALGLFRYSVATLVALGAAVLIYEKLPLPPLPQWLPPVLLPLLLAAVGFAGVYSLTGILFDPREQREWLTVFKR